MIAQSSGASAVACTTNERPAFGFPAYLNQAFPTVDELLQDLSRNDKTLIGWPPQVTVEAKYAFKLRPLNITEVECMAPPKRD